MDKKQAKAMAIEAVKEAGKILMGNINKNKNFSFKRKNDIVTEMDLKSETLIINKIKKTFPAHNMYSEEEGLIDNKSPYTWFLDPIDGTMNYYHASSPFEAPQP